MRACDDEQGSSSPVRHECNEQGRSARAQGSSPALCRVPRAMNEWAWAKGEPRQSRVGSKRAAPQRALPRTRARSLARSERKLACHERCAQHYSRAQRAMSPAQRAMSRAQRAMARVRRALARAQRGPQRAMACDGRCSSYATSAWAARTWPAMAVCVRPMGVQRVGCLRFD